MKITQIQTLILSRLHEPENQWFSNTFRVVKADCAIVMAHTDEGITGIGEACAYGGPELIRDWVTFYKEPPMIREGVLHFSDKPGLGVKLADELEQRFPYFTGAWGLQIQRDDIKVAAQ